MKEGRGDQLKEGKRKRQEIAADWWVSRPLNVYSSPWWLHITGDWL